jgi:hypothetical protein
MRWTLLLVLVLTLCAVPVGAQPTLSFQGSDVVATQLTPGANVILFAISRETPAWMPHVVSHVEVIPGEKNDGQFTFNGGTGAQSDSIWTVVEVDTGLMALAIPEGAPVRQLPAGALGLATGESNVAVSVTTGALTHLHLLLVRPGAGAWSLVSRDGGDTDHDGTVNGSQLLDLPDFAALWGEVDSPSELEPGDFLIALDSESMSYAVGVTEKE